MARAKRRADTVAGKTCRRIGHKRTMPELACERCGARPYAERGTGIVARAKTPPAAKLTIVGKLGPTEPIDVPPAPAAGDDGREYDPPLTDGPPPDVSYAADMAPTDPAAALNDTAASMPQVAPVAPGATETIGPASAPQVDPAAALNAEAGATSEPEAAPAPIKRPCVTIPNIIARGAAAKGLTFLVTLGSGWGLKKFHPRNRDGSRFRPGPPTIPVTAEMVEAFDEKPEEYGITADKPLQWPVGEVLSEGLRVGFERAGWTNDVELHPLLVIVGGLLAIPACMMLRSPDANDDDGQVEPEHDNGRHSSHGDGQTSAAGSFETRPAPSNGERRHIPSLDALRGGRANRPRVKDAAE